MEDEEKQEMKEQQEQDKEIQLIEQSYDAGEDNFCELLTFSFPQVVCPGPDLSC